MQKKLLFIMGLLMTITMAGCQNTNVKLGDKITVDYVGKLTNGTVFDTSIESVAKENGKYQTGRDYSQGLSFTVGAGQMIAGFDKGVEGMKIGETKTVNIPAKEAYGERSEKNVMIIPKDALPGSGKNLKEGDKLMTPYGQTVIIKEITKT
jgi:FKBP-type peptidyl-prolyl cis-trans isomerase 2